jgi:5,10-methylene-tetrahydrofolate dehydrogenase/methenyl tetrahydrofolate cyclohydrolase
LPGKCYKEEEVKYLKSNQLVANMVGRQAEALHELKGSGVLPHMQIIREESAQSDPEVSSYTHSLVAHARILGRLAGIDARELVSVRSVPSHDVVPLTRRANRDRDIHGVIHMSPMAAFDAAASTLTRTVDIDRMAPEWSRHGWTRDPVSNMVVTGDIPITAEATQRLLQHHGKIEEGTVVTQFGRGRTVGGPLAESLGSLGVDLRVVGRNTSDEERRAMLVESDVVIGAVGKPVIRASELHDGQTVVGVGLDDIYGDVYASSLDIEVTPMHRQAEWGVGRVTSAGAWERTIQNAADLEGMQIALGGYAMMAS